MTSMTDHLWRGTSEDFIQKVFQRYEQGMTLNDFSLFLQSSELILKELREAMRYESWVGGLHMKIKMSKNVKDSKPSTLTTSALLTINKKQSPVFLLTQENFLVLVTQKREIFNVLLVDACQLKRSGKTLKLFYFTHFEERLRLDFESQEICETFTENLKISGNLKDFQDFYKLSSRIGSGKFSIVYEAIEISSGLKWAVKVVKKKQLTRFEREMIRKEAEIARYLNRPGIIHVREVFESRKSLKIVMEFAEGGDMTKWFSGPPLPEDLIKKTLKQVLEAVDYLHSHAIMHRDLKPENILISEENWKISIIDFGLSSFFLPGECKKFKCGTLGYMAPEVVCGSYNEKVDIWSVGVLAYGCFTGRLPFSGYLDEDVLEMSQNSEPDYSKEKWREYSTGTVEFTKLLLLKDPELRPNCKEALNHPWLRDSE
jgi:calcium-dependent protein kinase